MNYGIVKPVLIAFFISVLLSPMMIRYLHKLKFGQFIRERGTRITSEEIRDSDDGRTDHITWNRNRIVILC